MNNQMKTRFAPSPTGFLHVGGARTALFCWLEARRRGGSMVLRIEDTDRSRSTQEAEDAILEGMKWLGLEWDEGPYYQSRRTDRYLAVIQQLLERGSAYYCDCSAEELGTMREQQKRDGKKPRYDGRCRSKKVVDGDDRTSVIRFRNPVDGQVIIDDLVRGRVVIDNRELDDLIIARSDGSPTYNLTVVVDDIEMGITEVIRGEDHLTNTARQINIYRALEVTPPKFAHISLIHGSDGAKLSKRHGAVSVLQYREEGFLPDALINYLVRLGWSCGDKEEFSREEMLNHFRIEDVSKSASVFNSEKLRWLNHQYIVGGDPQVVAGELAWHFDRAGIAPTHGPELEQIVSAFAERSNTLVEMCESARFLYEDFAEYDPGAAKKQLRPVARPVLERVLANLEVVDIWEVGALKAAVQDTVEDLGIGMGKVGQPLRVAVVGRGASPAIDVTLQLLGRERTLARIKRAIDFIIIRENAQ